MATVRSWLSFLEGVLRIAVAVPDVVAARKSFSICVQLAFVMTGNVERWKDFKDGRQIRQPAILGC